jgi:MFS family permease
MVVAPVSQALVADLYPEDMRGRYMAVFGISWMMPFAIGPYLAGLILDGSRPANLWFVAGGVGFAAAFWFLRLHRGRTAKIQDEKTLE